ncbi:ferredoxin:protochlorophyllide reductase (ATP-dependent) subunit B [Blastochloris viridis]|uniref:Light-independent protochlorophyllide reductase subunit B n=1 Tax=Blastochloris viridis TaxID=1079 RepID=A0A0H5B838_BLAVI|nr:ferredoxin:protochlorophyllide reductase (ATP-dependent) subunit B [Blastochloris viridis]ALK08368.1 Light-independent protochlorophyllide reductase subunit B [Blastochloris viridis]BAR98360.1 light-independent protochlorophyllide reductase subunit B [Blastochloris viridis]CUU41030.1 Light-independent protochlorophyllide reductase subunit B [Blastochloris viridis]
MQLTVWTYEGPPHIGAMRVATAMEGLHYVLHAPQGDTYADLLFTMIERRSKRPPVSYSTFQARDLGADTAELFQETAREAYERFKPQALLVGSSCTAELIQDDPGGLARALNLPIPVVQLDLPSYQRKEIWGAAETFYQLVRALCAPHAPKPGEPRPAGAAGAKPRCNLLGPTALGFRHRDDVVEITRLLGELGIEVAVTAPLGATPADVARLGEADFNVVLYPETAGQAAGWLKRTFGQPFTTVVPIGYGATRDFINEVAQLAGVDPSPVLSGVRSRLPWYSRSVDSTYLTGKRVFIFADGTHAVAAARIAAEEFGFTVVGLGTYAREFAREVREAAKRYDVEPLITDDYLEVEAKVAEAHPDLVLGTQMERHIAKRLGIPCAVISAPVHVQDFPARYAPQMGFEGANVIFDTWVHPLMMGLEEHLLTMFRKDSEFHDAPSHLGGALPSAAGAETDASLPGSEAVSLNAESAPSSPTSTTLPASLTWVPEAEKELRKIPFFVRGKARRNTERFALERGVSIITVDTLYDAKAHFGR